MKTRIHPLFFVAIALSVFTAPTQAGILFWDGTSTTADADGGNGTWDTILTNWDSLATAGVDTAWPSTGTDNDALFGGTAGTVTIDALGVTANDLTFSTANYILQGGKITLNGTTPTITNAVAATINSEIAGTAGLTKTGAGTLTLGGVNTYTGTTTISGGTLKLSGGNDRLATTGTVAFSGSSTLDLDGNSQTLANLSLTGSGTYTGTVTNGSLSLTGVGNVTISPSVLIATTATVDLSGLSSFTVSKSASNLTFGGNGIATQSAAQSVTLKLSATTNAITALNFQVGVGGPGSIVNNAVLQLGAANTINATNFFVGSTRSTASVVFQSGLLTPTVTLRALTGGSDRMTSFMVGINGAGGTAGNTQHADFSLGAIDARITTLTVSQGQSAATTGAPPTVLGTFSMGTGTVDATSIMIAENAGGGGNQTNTGSFNQQAGTVSTGTLTLGRRAGTATFTAVPRLLATYTLGTSTTSGTLFAGSITAGTGAVLATSTRTLAINNGTIRNLDASTDLTINGTGLAGTGNNIVITLASGGTATFQADALRSITLGANTGISGAGSLTKTGSGILNLNAANTYTGETRPQTGSIVLGAVGALGTSVLNMVATDTGTINFGTSTALTLGGIKGDRNLSIANGSAVSQSLIIGNASNYTYSSTLTGLTTALAKVGAGTQTFSGASNSWSVGSFQTRAGTFELNAGIMAVTGSATTTYGVGQTGFTVVGGSTFRLNGGTVNVSGSSFVFTAGHTTGGTGNFNLDSGIFNAGNIEVLNAYGAAGTTTINGGTFTAGTFRVAQSTGILNLNGGTLRVNNLSTGGGTSTINFNGGTVEAKQDNASFLPTTITNAKIRANGAVFNTNTFNVTVAKDLTEDATSTGGGLTKQGSGALTLSGVNTYTGDTTVTAGTLLVNNASGSGTGTGAVKVTGTALGSIVATLGGTGTISGATTIGALGKLSPTAQASGSKLSLGSTLAFDSGGTSIFNWDLSAADTPDPGDVSNNGSYGQVAVTGAVTNTAIFNIALLGGTGKTTSYADAFWDTNKTWDNIFVKAGLTNLSTLFTSFTGSGLTASGSGSTAIATAAGQGYFSFNSGTTLSWSAVPEPTTALAGILLGAGLLRRRR